MIHIVTEVYCFSDLDECLEAATYYIDLCSQNTVCVNTEGAYECPCLSGFKLTNGTCQSKLWMIEIACQIQDEEFCAHIMLTGKIEAPPPVQQVAPPNAEANRLKVVITGLVPGTVRELDVPSIWCSQLTKQFPFVLQFTTERKQSFKEVTAELVTEYCSVKDCGQISSNSRRRFVTMERVVTWFIYMQIC